MHTDADLNMQEELSLEQYESAMADYMLLREMIQAEKSDDLGKLAPLRKEITGIWEAFKDNAPPDFGSLYAEFQAEYEKLKDFLLYSPLLKKSIVALGGGFSSGKSSFLNALMKRTLGEGYRDDPILPENIDPSTSVPTYLVQGEEPRLSGVNIFDCRFEMPADAICCISHGFGAVGEGEKGVTLGHIVRNLFLSVPFQPYEHIAFLDTPGYSAPDEASYSAKTDAQIARQQLNTANYILWFVQANAGTTTEKDLAFLQTLRRDIPKLVILSKADSLPPEKLEDVRKHLLNMMQLKNIPVEGVLTFSAREPERCQTEELEQWLQKINKPNCDNQFAINFKKLFLRTRDFYEERQERERRRLEVLNQVLTLNQDGETSDMLRGLVQECRNAMEDLRQRADALRQRQTAFFRELKTVGDLIELKMPEPDEIELLGERRRDVLDTLKRCLTKRGIRPSPQIRSILQRELSGVDVAINREAGGLEYRERLTGLLSQLLAHPGEIHINDVVKEGTGQ